MLMKLLRRKIITFYVVKHNAMLSVKFTLKFRNSMQKLKNIYVYRMSQEEWTKLRESVPYVKVYRYNPKYLYPKLNGYGDNGQRSLKL